MSKKPLWTETMANNRRRRRYRFGLFPLFPQSRPARLKFSRFTRRPKIKAPLKEPQTDEEPICSQTQVETKSWRMRVGEARKFFASPIKGLRKSFSGLIVSSSKRAQKFSAGNICGCHRGGFKRTRSGSSDSRSDESNPAEFSYEYVKDLLENNNFYTNSSTLQENWWGIDSYSSGILMVDLKIILYSRVGTKCPIIHLGFSCRRI